MIRHNFAKVAFSPLTRLNVQYIFFNHIIEGFQARQPLLYTPVVVKFFRLKSLITIKLKIKDDLYFDLQVYVFRESPACISQIIKSLISYNC